ncbi:hypothetical protein LTSEHVI_2711 [Salmonella enterica subsp. enterica serovar Hvittingfoss str. A4-620]|nr:hypothetical protein LTSEHVI_2711 [Salmonella enterica subsp. enterica serovar Hvittingfoss str. A4-620]
MPPMPPAFYPICGDAAGFLSHFTCRYLCLFLATQPPL